jgi:hypothetical protein
MLEESSHHYGNIDTLMSDDKSEVNKLKFPSIIIVNNEQVAQQQPAMKSRTRFKGSYQASSQANEKMKNVWIVKPGENTNRGNGISVCCTLN